MLCLFLIVSRRTGGLENMYLKSYRLILVSRRTGGLENNSINRRFKT